MTVEVHVVWTAVLAFGRIFDVKPHRPIPSGFCSRRKVPNTCKELVRLIVSTLLRSSFPLKFHKIIQGAYSLKNVCKKIVRYRYMRSLFYSNGSFKSIIRKQTQDTVELHVYIDIHMILHNLRSFDIQLIVCKIDFWLIIYNLQSCRPKKKIRPNGHCRPGSCVAPVG